MMPASNDAPSSSFSRASAPSSMTPSIPVAVFAGRFFTEDREHLLEPFDLTFGLSEVRGEKRFELAVLGALCQLRQGFDQLIFCGCTCRAVRR